MRYHVLLLLLLFLIHYRSSPVFDAVRIKTNATYLVPAGYLAARGGHEGGQPIRDVHHVVVRRAPQRLREVALGPDHARHLRTDNTHVTRAHVYYIYTRSIWRCWLVICCLLLVGNVFLDLCYWISMVVVMVVVDVGCCCCCCCCNLLLVAVGVFGWLLVVVGCCHSLLDVVIRCCCYGRH